MTEASQWHKAAVLVLREFDMSTLPRRERAAYRKGKPLAPYPDVIECGDDVAGEPETRAYVYALSGFWLTRLGHPAGFAHGGEVRDAFFADAACTALICRTIVVPTDGVRRHHVVDPAGDVVGTIDRVPWRNRFVRHTCRLRQPGRPELSAGRVTLRRVRDAGITGALMVAVGYVEEFVLPADGGGDSGDTGAADAGVVGPTAIVQKALTSRRRARHAVAGQMTGGIGAVCEFARDRWAWVSPRCPCGPEAVRDGGELVGVLSMR